MPTGIEVELLLLLLIQTLGTSIFAVFEIETPAWRKILKWVIIVGLTLGLFPLLGHWSLLCPAALLAVGVAVHLTWCRKHGIHPVKATPRRKYYELRGWEWVE